MARQWQWTGGNGQRRSDGSVGATAVVTQGSVVVRALLVRTGSCRRWNQAWLSQAGHSGSAGLSYGSDKGSGAGRGSNGGTGDGFGDWGEENTK